MRLELEGIGAELQSEDGTTIVRRVVPGGAADKDGQLKDKDKIVGVGEGAEGEIVDVVDMKLDDVVKLIRGQAGTVVRLQVVDAEGAKQKIINITRAKIELKDEEAQGEVFEVGRKSDGKPYKLGVIALPSFYMDMEGARRGLTEFKSTTRDVRRLLEKFTAEGVDAVILDLRRNGGGSLTEAINLTGLFIDEGPVVQVKGPDGKISAYPDTEPGAAWSGPLVVLTSKFSASASEILAGAIQDYGRGLIVGDRATHGKGTVQSLMNLARQLFGSGQLGALKITMQQFYRPNGDSTQNRGVLADVELPSLTTHLDVGESDLDYPVAFDKVDSAAFNRLGLVSKPICDRLKDLSAQRCQESEDFKKVARNIQRYEEQKQRKVVTLNEKKFLEERAELNADKEEQKKLEELNSRNHKAIERDYYLNEALAVTLDYIQLMHVAQAN
jgi:carboxyl-terminal processing protease